MKKNKNNKLKAKIQALSNQLTDINPKKNQENVDKDNNLDLAIKKDILVSVILILVSFGILFMIKFLDSNFFLDKFF